MFLLIPYTRFTLKVYLPAHEAEQRLAAHVEPRKMRWELSRNHKVFQGTVANGKFNIERIIHFRNTLLPVIVGQIHDDLGTSRIEITMRMSYFAIAFMVIFVAIFLSLESSSGMVVSFFGSLILFYGINMVFFIDEVNIARRHLKRIFQFNKASF